MTQITDSSSSEKINIETETSISVDDLKSTLKSSATDQPNNQTDDQTHDYKNNHSTETNQSTENKEQASLPAQKEIGGRGGLDPVRYGDWEKSGRCIDF